MTRAAASRLAAAVLLCLLPAGCGGGGKSDEPTPPPKRFPVPLFDGLALGMTRDRVAKVHPIRLALSAAGRSRRLWIYEKRGDYAAELTFRDGGSQAPLVRIDVHFGPSDASPEAYIERFARRLGPPEVTRRKAAINAYGDHRHDQYDTIWSDATQYVFLTERVPIGGARGRPVYYLTVKKKELAATGPPTGYVPPPPPKGEDGKPVEEDIF
ncbi:MAG: hypothetical protein ACRD6R_06400 [Candidatus Polarisedimenticolia bacterium]